MKVTAYGVKNFEKEFLAKSNQKKHDITLISNALNLETTGYAEGKDAVIVFTDDHVPAYVIHELANLGVKYITTRSIGTAHIDKSAAAERGIKLANIPLDALDGVKDGYGKLDDYEKENGPLSGKQTSHLNVITIPQPVLITAEALQQICDQTIKNLDLWQLGKCVGKACVCVKNCR
jgi:D-lactate dehydrogenase